MYEIYIYEIPDMYEMIYNSRLCKALMKWMYVFERCYVAFTDEIILTKLIFGSNNDFSLNGRLYLFSWNYTLIELTFRCQQ